MRARRRNIFQDAGLRAFVGSVGVPESRRAWTEQEVARLKAMAGTIPVERIAAELGRTVGAIAVEASKRGLSLRTKPRGRRSKADAEWCNSRKRFLTWRE
jgi:hypothetical protein